MCLREGRGRGSGKEKEGGRERREREGLRQEGKVATYIVHGADESQPAQSSCLLFAQLALAHPIEVATEGLSVFGGFIS